MDKLSAFKSAVKNSPFAYSYLELICDNLGRPIDCIFVDVNSSFEKMIGLTSKKIIGKKMTQILPIINDNTFDWADFYNDIALNKLSRTFDKYSDRSQKWYRIFIHSPKKGHFYTLICSMDEQTIMSPTSNTTGFFEINFLLDQFELLDIEANINMSIIYADINGLYDNKYNVLSNAEVIKIVKQVIVSICGDLAITTQIRNDEFCILLEEVNDKEANIVYNNLKDEMKKLKHSIGINVSFGMASKFEPTTPLNVVMLSAINNMHKEKLLKRRSTKAVTIPPLITTLGEKPFETKERTERLQKYAELIADKLALDARDRDDLVLLSKLHDIGKLSIPEDILLKEEPITKEEREIIEKHSESGVKMIGSSELSDISQAILAHHERWDGKGYPRGLKGEEIPLISRIIAVVVAFDAMTSDRPYRKTVTIAQAAQEILNCAGTQFDPKVSYAFYDILQDVIKK